MTQRTYHQYCPIAHALDLVGERWTLLIARDLLLGPKRFSDLLSGLSGIGTNILTDRLKSLEQAGLVQRRVLPPPAASAVYELTPYGQTLETPLVALAQWGGQSLGASQPGQAISRDSVMLTARALVRALPPTDEAATYVVQIEDVRLRERFNARLANGVAELTSEVAANPDLVLSTSVDTLFELVRGGVSLREAVDGGLARVDGRPELVAHLLDGAARLGAEV